MSLNNGCHSLSAFLKFNARLPNENGGIRFRIPVKA